ncbi:MAG: AAA family ATPase, partial [Acidimicrobiales bacterium]
MTSEEPDAFVGRSHELAAAEAALHRLAGGVGGLMVGVGEAGIGKSAWGRQIGLRAAAQGVLVLAGRAPASGAQTPYGAVTSALAPHLRRLPAADLGCLLSDLPSLGAVFEGVGLPVPSLDDAGLLRTRLAVAVLCLLGRLAADRPVLVWIDDVHWIDPASAALMEQV